MCDVLGRLEHLSVSFPRNTGPLYEDTSDFGTFGAVIGIHNERTHEDLVSEMFGEVEQQQMAYGELEPVYNQALSLGDPDSLSTLRRALEAAKESLELTQQLYDTLEVTSCLSP